MAVEAVLVAIWRFEGDTGGYESRVVVAQQRLGRAKPSTTLNTYGHALPGDQRVAAGKVVAAIHRARTRSDEWDAER